jgi:hypothetical protein
MRDVYEEGPYPLPPLRHFCHFGVIARPKSTVFRGGLTPDSNLLNAILAAAAMLTLPSPLRSASLRNHNFEPFPSSGEYSWCQGQLPQYCGGSRDESRSGAAPAGAAATCRLPSDRLRGGISGRDHNQSGRPAAVP